MILLVSLRKVLELKVVRVVVDQETRPRLVITVGAAESATKLNPGPLAVFTFSSRTGISPNPLSTYGANAK